jgi:hypothetical protein
MAAMFHTRILAWIAALGLGLAAAALVGAEPDGIAAPRPVEVHLEALSGSRYASVGDYLSAYSTADSGNGVFQLVPAGSGPPELGFIKQRNTGTGKVEIHWETLQTGSYKVAGAKATAFSLGDVANGTWDALPTSTGAPMVGFVKLRNTGTGKVEVHWETLQNGVYASAGDYASDFSTADAGNGVWQLVPTSAGPPELGFIKVFDTGSGKVEVHLDTLQSGHYVRVGNYVTGFAPANNADGVWDLFGSSGGAPMLGFIKLTATETGTVEPHWETLQSGVYKNAGDKGSGFASTQAPDGSWQLYGTSSGAPTLGFVFLGPPPAPTPAPTTKTLTTTTPASAPLPSPPVVTKPVQLTVAPHGGRRARRLRARIYIGWTWHGAHTRLRYIRFRGLPRGARVELSCRGRGCPRKHLVGRWFRAGDRLTITVTARGRSPERAVVTIRSGELPSVRSR